MSNRFVVEGKTGGSLFALRRLVLPLKGVVFDCSIPEYNEYLEIEAEKAQREFVATTWFLYERKSSLLAAYMSLINDAIQLSAAEKELHHLDYPFKTIPAMKIAKLAVSKSFREKYRGIGSYMIYLAASIAEDSNLVSACRFLTVDADIEHDEGVLAFYQKNGFLRNDELYNKKRKTISMRKDIWVSGFPSSNGY